MSGRSTAILRGVVSFKSCRMLCSSSATSVRLLNLGMPMVLQNERMLAGV